VEILGQRWVTGHGTGSFCTIYCLPDGKKHVLRNDVFFTLLLTQTLICGHQKKNHKHPKRGHFTSTFRSGTFEKICGKEKEPIGGGREKGLRTFEGGGCGGENNTARKQQNGRQRKKQQRRRKNKIRILGIIENPQRSRWRTNCAMSFWDFKLFG